MMDDGITTAKEYHWATKHIRHRIKPHYLDFKNYPDQVKSYDFVKKIDLTKDLSNIDVDLNSIFIQLQSDQDKAGLSRPFRLNTLSEILLLPYGVSRTGYANGVPFYFRTVPSAGGLYPCHLYLAVRSMDGLETGLYYCNMIQGFLGLIQRGENPVQEKNEPSFSFIITGEFFNSSWKYRERAFRYILLDSGHLIENISLAIKASGRFFSIDYDFDDEKISRFLSLDNTKEVPLACVNVGQDKHILKNLIEAGPDLIGPKAEVKKRLSTATSYPLLQKIYDLSKAGFCDNGADSQNIQVVTAKSQKTISLSDLKADLKDQAVKINYRDAVIRRRSKRNFIPKELDMNKAIALIRLASDLLGSQADQAGKVDPYLALGISCRNVSGLDDGFYLFSRDRLSLLLISNGQFQDNLSQVCLDQRWIANAALNFLFMANLASLEKNFGPRGYRHLLMQSGRIAQRIYLAATGLELGCCGVGALYDEEAQNLFDLNEESALFYVVSTGPVKK
ncbi:MAG: SagB family peptide dehydrogenase [Deltaproteobacteria bacterium]|nr:SagB family peptide dehydrogenase [Deltaproteobacteria bacterium]